MKLLNLIIQMIQLKYIGLADNKKINYFRAKRLLSNNTSDNHVLDNSYITLSKDDVKKILKINFLKNLQYRKEVFDCDDFAFNFMWFIRNLFGNVAVGVVFIEYKNGTRHALNFTVAENQKIMFIEPQTGKFRRMDDNKIYFMIM